MAIDLSKIVGGNLYSMYSRLQMSQIEFADILGISPALLSSIFSGSRRLQMPMLIRVCQMLSVDPDYFFSLDDDEFSMKDDIIDVDALDDSDVAFLNGLADLLIKQDIIKEGRTNVLSNFIRNNDDYDDEDIWDDFLLSEDDF